MPNYKRILVKLTGESLSGEAERGLNGSQIKETAKHLISIAKKGIQVGVVVGGGNILRGEELSDVQGFDRVSSDQMGMLATIINALALREAIKSEGHHSSVLSSIAMPKVCEAFTRSRALEYLENDYITIFAGGTGNPYFTTDTTAALKALEISAEVLLKGTKVDGIYTEDPKLNPDAVKYETLSYDEALIKNLKVMDQTAFALCRENSMPIIVFNFMDGEALHKIIDGDKVGTLISN